ncbi:MAG: single-stranded-DNA-specific exonuclease RecJ [bacterium]|nr:single-stranded-DNA-specific exonuclease RecJ [bacterium]
MQEKIWNIAEAAPLDWQNKFPELPSFLRQLLWSRGLRTQEAIDEFLNPDYGKDIHDPFLLKDMAKAVERIFNAINKKEKIAIYGDYDADGVTGSVILETTLKALGAEISEVHLPHREKEGYGLNKKAVEHLIAAGSKVIITCDCGIANFDEVALAQNQGVDVIITDHHSIPEVLPPACVILHPLLPDSGYPFPYLTGGGVAYKLAQGLLRQLPPLRLRGGEVGLGEVNNAPQPLLTLRGGEMYDGFEKWLLDLVAISTIADVGKLIGENRTLVKYGLIVLKKTRRLGLKKLYEVAKINPDAIDAWSVAFQITPRINAAGRMNHANAAYNLLASQNEEEAGKLAYELNQTNQERQKETEKIVAEAKKQIGAGEKYFLSACGEAWPVGIIGLAAGKISDEFHRPAVLATKNEEGLLIGSARSINQFDIIEAFRSASSLFIKFGGHPKAAGFSLKGKKEWKAFQKRMEELAQEKLRGFDLSPSLTIDAAVNLGEVNWELWNNVVGLEPFGEGNPRPKFLAKNLKVAALDRVGNDGKHLRLTVTDDSRVSRKMIGFSFGVWRERLSLGDKIDAVFEVGVNTWNGNQELELKIVDIKHSKL